MAKDAYYFPHDSNAHHDPKILQLRVIFGWEGYGIYWAIIESLRDCPEYKMPLDAKAGLQLGLSLAEATLEGVLESCYKFGLLCHNETHFWSPSLDRRMIRLDEKRQKLVEAGRRGAAIRYQDKATLKPPLSHPNSHPIAVKHNTTQHNTTHKNTLKHNKTKMFFIVPTIEQVKEYCQERKNKIDPQYFFDRNSATGWVDKNGNKYKDWKAVIRTWEKWDSTKTESMKDNRDLWEKKSNKQCMDCRGSGAIYAPGSGKYSKCHCVHL